MSTQPNLFSVMETMDFFWSLRVWIPIAQFLGIFPLRIDSHTRDLHISQGAIFCTILLFLLSAFFSVELMMNFQKSSFENTVRLLVEILISQLTLVIYFWLLCKRNQWAHILIKLNQMKYPIDYRLMYRWTTFIFPLIYSMIFILIFLLNILQYLYYFENPKRFLLNLSYCFFEIIGCHLITHFIISVYYIYLLTKNMNIEFIQHFNLSNSTLERIASFKSCNYQEIKKLKSFSLRYLSFCEIAQELSQFFSLFNLIIITSAFLMITLCLYNLIGAFITQGPNIYAVGLNLCWLILFCTKLLSISLICDKAFSEVSTTKFVSFFILKTFISTDFIYL